MKKLIAFSTAAAMLAGALPAFAAGDVVINTTNSATVTNSVTSSASTGGNTANGARAVGRVRGGNVTDSDYGNGAGNDGGTVLGGMGGIIQTGDALSTSHVENELNSLDADIAAADWAVNDIRVTVGFNSAIDNGIDAAAGSGDNVANGARARNSIRGGNLDTVGSSNTAGNTGGHLEAGSGGAIGTGMATSHSSAVNVLNRSIVRIRK